MHCLQVLWSAFVSGPVSMTPSFIAAGAAALWLRQQQTPQQLRQAISQLPGLCATAMFALAPIPQLVGLGHKQRIGLLLVAFMTQPAPDVKAWSSASDTCNADHVMHHSDLASLLEQ
eukprot:GHUV01026609.1.p3 GENE.GHUV01026609.1~~GHUV01026609.1.p3  ORF type:complete len:117 (-),score=39.45 GHUV01026609.1:632-982(-)